MPRWWPTAGSGATATSSSCGRPRRSASSAPRFRTSPYRSSRFSLSMRRRSRWPRSGRFSSSRSSCSPFRPASGSTDGRADRSSSSATSDGRPFSPRSRSRTSRTSLTLVQLFVVAFLYGICTVFFDVAYQSYLPSLVEREQIIEGNSKLEVSRSAAQIAGPGLGGILVEILTSPYAVLVDAVSFLGSGFFILGIRNRVEHHVAAARRERPRLWPELKEGLRFVFGNPFLRAQAGCTATANFFFSFAFSIILVYFVRVLDLSPGVIGIVLSIGSIGSMAAALTTRRLTSRFGVGPTTLAARVPRRAGAAAHRARTCGHADPVPCRLGLFSRATSSSSTTSIR